jgi:hypothetical protein
VVTKTRSARASQSTFGPSARESNQEGRNESVDLVGDALGSQST